MKKTLINNKWELWLPDHRAARPEWPVWEKERLESMNEEIVKLINYHGVSRPIIFDVGAEEGDFPALYSQWGADVVLFEPNERVWPNIKAIWEANKLNRPLHSFVGFASSRDRLSPDYSFHGRGSDWPHCANGPLIGDHGFKELADAGDIAEVTLDSVWRKSGITPDIITIDVEGSEFEVLKGAKDLLEAKNPLVYVSIHPEFMYHHFKQYTAELVKYMTDLGYGYEILAFDHEFHFLFKPL